MAPLTHGPGFASDCRRKGLGAAPRRTASGTQVPPADRLAAFVFLRAVGGELQGPVVDPVEHTSVAVEEQ